MPKPESEEIGVMGRVVAVWAEAQAGDCKRFSHRPACPPVPESSRRECLYACFVWIPRKLGLMKFVRTICFHAFMISFCGLVTSCTYFINTVQFSEAKSKQQSSSFAPGVEIDDNMRVPFLIAGPIYSSKPYDLRIYHYDPTFSFAKLEISRLEITYDDGSPEPLLQEIKLPLQFNAKDHESYNSTSEGIVTNKSLQLNASFPRVISRATPLTLHAEGRLIKKNGTKIPFVINKRYEVERFKAIASWVEVAKAI